MIPGRRYTPEDALKIALRRKWFIIAPLCLAMLVVVGLLRVMPRKYVSETVILVVPQRVPESYVRSTVTTRIEDRLQSIRQQILSRTRLERIILDFDLYPEARAVMALQDVVPFMRNEINVNMVRGDAFTVSFVHERPDVAQKVTERLASLVIDENLRDRQVVAEGTNEFLETQLEQSRVRLEEHEKKLEAYRRTHLGELPTQAESNMQAIQNLQAQAQGLTDSIARDRDRLFVVERELSDMPARIEAGLLATQAATAPAKDADGLPVGSATERLPAARQSLRELETRFKPEHPDVIRMKAIIRDLEVKSAEERKTASERRAGDTPVAPPTSQAAIRESALRDERANLNRQISQKDGQLANIRAQIGSYQARLDATPTRESEMVALMRDYDTLKKVYTDLLTKREDSKVAANLEQRQIGEQFKILDPANRPETPFSPNTKLIAVAGLGGGLALGAALILLLELRDRTFRADTDVQQALKLPVLAMIPKMPNAAERARRRWRMALTAGAGVVMLGVVSVAMVAAYAWLLR